MAGVSAPDADDLSAVVDGLKDALEGDGPGFFFEVEPVRFLDVGEGLAVRLRNPEGVVVEFAGDVGLGGGDPDDAVGSAGGEEGR